MSLDWWLFALRVLSAAALMAILTALFWILWRDYRSTLARSELNRRSHGRLTSLIEFDNNYIPFGDHHPLMPITSLGRAPINDIVIDDNFASSEHAVITLRDGQWWLEDRNSRNGTLLNGERIYGSIIVTDGDIISIGRVNYRLELE